MYVLTVTETLEAWEDSVNIGTFSLHLLVCHDVMCVSLCREPAHFFFFFFNIPHPVIYVKPLHKHGDYMDIGVCGDNRCL